MAEPLDAALADDEVRRAVDRLRPGASISFRVVDDGETADAGAGEAFTYRIVGGRFVRTPGADADTVVVLARATWTDLIGLVRSFVNLHLAGELTFERGGFDGLADWDPAIKLIHARIPLYDPSRVDLSDIDPGASFPVDTDDAILRDRLHRLGFLHVRGVFDATEIAAMNAAVDELATAARPGDNQSWWVTTEAGDERLCRLVYATQRSETLRRVENDPRIARFGTMLRDDLRLAPDRMEGASVLLKVPGQTRGLSNIPWHQDCGMGGHSFMCPAISIGVQLTGSNAETGNLTTIPASHGQTLHYQWEHRLDGVPIVAIDTEPGDITVHVQDLMHASPEPTGAGGRRTMYQTFYPPTLWDHVGAGQAFNDLVRNRQGETAALARR